MFKRCHGYKYVVQTWKQWITWDPLLCTLLQLTQTLMLLHGFYNILDLVQIQKIKLVRFVVVVVVVVVVFQIGALNTHEREREPPLYSSDISLALTIFSFLPPLHHDIYKQDARHSTGWWMIKNLICPCLNFYGKDFFFLFFWNFFFGQSHRATLLTTFLIPHFLGNCFFLFFLHFKSVRC